MAKLSQQRMGEIAFTLLMEKLERDGGFRIGADLRRELGNLSKKTNIPREELEEFAKVTITRMLGRAFGMQHVSLEMSDPISK
jgi:hypothetical protein